MKDDVLAAVTTTGVITSFAADTLPLLQWLAAAVAVISGAIFLYDRFTRAKRNA